MLTGLRLRLFMLVLVSIAAPASAATIIRDGNRVLIDDHGTERNRLSPAPGGR